MAFAPMGIQPMLRYVLFAAESLNIVLFGRPSVRAHVTIRE